MNEQQMNAWALKKLTKINIPLKLKLNGKLNLNEDGEKMAQNIMDEIRRAHEANIYIKIPEIFLKLGNFNYYNGSLIDADVDNAIASGIYEEKKEHKMKSICEHNRKIIELAIKKLKASIKDRKKLLKQNQKAGDHQGEMKQWHWLIYAYFQVGSLDKSFDATRQAHSMAMKYGLKKEERYLARSIKFIDILERMHEKALKRLEKKRKHKA